MKVRKKEIAAKEEYIPYTPYDYFWAFILLSALI